jgi:hypothetical protein
MPFPSVPAANDPAEARRLYLRLVKRHHPDLSAPEQREISTELTQQINSAWDARDIIKLRDIEAHGVAFFAWEAERRKWAAQAAEIARERARREAVRRREEVAAAPARPEPAAEMAWGPRPAFSHVDTARGMLIAIFLFANPWNPCANWAVSGDYLALSRYLVQLAVIAAWACAGTWLFQIAGQLRASGGLLPWVEGLLGQAAALALALFAFARLLQVALVPTATLLGALCCAWLASLALRTVPGGVELAYGAAVGCWIYAFWMKAR